MGQKPRLAFRKNGLHAYGGYIEGFLPASFSLEAVSGDNKILSFLRRSNAVPVLSKTKQHFQLERGESVVKFEAAADVPLPTWPDVKNGQPLEGIDLKSLESMLDCIPKTGWGVLHPEMLGVVLMPLGIFSTDSASLGWITMPTFERRAILPRPFCLALITWAAELGDDFDLLYGDNGVSAEWKDGARLFGQLPDNDHKPLPVDGFFPLMEEAIYAPIPAGLLEALEEAAIFGEAIIVDGEQPGKLGLSTPDSQVFWQRDMAWANTNAMHSISLQLKRLVIALKAADEIAIGKERVFLRKADGTFFVVISQYTQAAADSKK